MLGASANKIGSMIALAIFLGLTQSAMAFLLAGTWSLPFFWAALGIQTLVLSIGAGFLDPALIDERLHPPGHQDKDTFGPLILGILYPAHLALAALDVGCWHLSDTVPLLVRLPALLLLAAGWSGLMWTMRINKFFSRAVRVQHDREQTVVADGPYRLVRHPGYAFLMLALLNQALALGSWLSCLPVLVIVCQLLYRLGLEEKLLTDQLDGYQDYVASVRFRLVPYIW